jgi:carboxylate-amine ligase
VIPSAFGDSPRLSLGVEEELMILDAETLAQAPRVGDLLLEVEGVDLPGRLKTELFASMVELNTDVCASPGDALAALAALRREAAGAAERLGLRLAAAGSHPLSDSEALEIVQEPRYLEMVEYAGLSARRQGVCGLHVHVGMPSGDACIRVLEAVLPWLPVVLALSANSPYLAGRETGFVSNRALVLAELPRSGAPPVFGSYAGWERHVERLAALELPSDYTALWWDARPHPRFGTLELRIPDQPTAPARTGAFVALLQALAAWALEEGRAAPDSGLRGVYQQNRWAAARFGPEAELIDAGVTRRVPVRELAGELLELVAPAARELGTLELVETIDPGRCEAEAQLEVGRSAGLRAVCADLVTRSLASA